MKNKILFPNDTIIKTELFNIGQDWETPIPGFFILSPLKKIKSIDEFSDEEALEFIKLTRKIRKGMKEVLKIKEVQLFQNEKTSGNFHLWIFPRYKRMEKFGDGIESIRPIMNYSLESMANDETFKEVKEYVEKMKEYMSEF